MTTNEYIILYLLIGFVIATIVGVKFIRKNPELDDYLMTILVVLVTTICWVFGLLILPIYIINKIRNK